MEKRSQQTLFAEGFPVSRSAQRLEDAQKGCLDDRFLWPEMLRIVQEIRPTWVIGENVVNIDRMALDQMVSDLETHGYEVAPPFEIPACAVGHDHRRSRYWFLGYANHNSESRGTLDAKTSGLSEHRFDSGSVGTKDGFSGGLDQNRRSVLGNAVVPQIPELIGRAILKAHET